MICLALSLLLFTAGIVFIQSNYCLALAPEQIVVVANKMAWHSVELAKYYMKARNIPSGNLIKIKAATDEICSREDYDRDIASPVRAFLKKEDPKGDRFNCVVTMYGVPLTVLAPKLTSEEQKQVRELQKRLDSIKEQIKKQEQQQNNEELKPLRDEEGQLQKQIDHVGKVFEGASVDSELALVREDHYSLEGWLPNKYYLGYRGKQIQGMPTNVILVSRLDGPSEKIVRRVIDDSLLTEQDGLKGKAYFDAQYPDPGEKEAQGHCALRPGDSQCRTCRREKQKDAGYRRFPGETFSIRGVPGCGALLRVV